MALESRIRQTENCGVPGTGRRHCVTPLPLADLERALRRKARYGDRERTGEGFSNLQLGNGAGPIPGYPWSCPEWVAWVQT